MDFKIILTKDAKANLDTLINNPSLEKRLKAVKKALNYLSYNPKHPGLNTHEHYGYSQEYGRKVFEAYAENHTPGAYRIFWIYGPDNKQITILSIIPHP